MEKLNKDLKIISDKEIFDRNEQFKLENLFDIINKYYNRETFSNLLRETMFKSEIVLTKTMKYYFELAPLHQLTKFAINISIKSWRNMTDLEIELYELCRLNELLFKNIINFTIDKIQKEIEKIKLIFESLKEINIYPIDVCKIITDYYVTF